MNEVKLYRLEVPNILVAVSSDEFDWKSSMHNFGLEFREKNQEFFDNNDPSMLFINMKREGKLDDSPYETIIPEIRDILFPNFTYSFITSKDQYTSISESLKQNNIDYVYWVNNESDRSLYWLAEGSTSNETIFAMLNLECTNDDIFA